MRIKRIKRQAAFDAYAALDALEALRAKVMVADARFNILYMNPALIELMQEAEVEIRLDLPAFQASALVGSNVDIFHKNPAHQRRLLEGLVGSHDAMIRVGGRPFDLKVTPLVKRGTSMGYVVEWSDAKERLLNVDYAGQIEAVSRTQATIEFDVEGVIIRANENFLGAVGYKLDEIVGRHHSLFVDSAERDSPEYLTFWSRLAQGQFQAGEFRRLGRSGKEIWIQGAYNPIFDHTGKVVKVVKFATVVTGRVEAMRAISAGLERLARNDLSYRVSSEVDFVFEKLKRDFNAAVEALDTTLSAVMSATGEVSIGATGIAGLSSDLLGRSEQQAAALEQSAAALDQITTTVNSTANSARQAAAAAGAVSGAANQAGSILGETVLAMSEIEAWSSKIAEIISVIDEIAFQTNLLALNAGVEAARAGEAGRGFAVVAQEVRALAQRSAEAAKQIKSLITASVTQVARGVRLVDDTSASLSDILEKVSNIDDLVAGIARSASEQAASINQVNAAVNQMDETTQRNASMVGAVAAAAASLNGEAHHLGQLLQRFHVTQGQSATSASPAKAVAPAGPGGKLRIVT